MSNVINKGAVMDASGVPIQSVRIVTDTDANSGIGTAADPLFVTSNAVTISNIAKDGTGAIAVSEQGLLLQTVDLLNRILMRLEADALMRANQDGNYIATDDSDSSLTTQ